MWRIMIRNRNPPKKKHKSRLLWYGKCAFVVWKHPMSHEPIMISPSESSLFHHCFHGFKPCFFHDHFWRCRQPPLLSTCARLGGGIGGSLGIKGGGLGTRMAHRTMAGLQIWTPKNGPLVHPKHEKRSTGVKHGKAPFWRRKSRKI